MNKTVKIITILLLAIMMINFLTNIVMAADEALLQPGNLTASAVNTGDLQSTAGRVMGFIRNIAVIASVIILMVLGVKFMLGSVEEKAEYKKSFMPLIIGIIVVLSAVQIATMIFNIGSGT